MPTPSEVKNQLEIDTTAEEATPLITPVTVIKHDVTYAGVEHGIAKYFGALAIAFLSISIVGTGMAVTGHAPDFEGAGVALGIAAVSGLASGISAALT